MTDDNTNNNDASDGKVSEGKMFGGKPSGVKRSRQTKPRADNATRMLHKKVRKAKGRKISSKLWIERQINDPYVQRAKELGYRSRAAFKLEELDDRYNLITPNSLIVDLGCAPGGWMQAAFKRGARRIVGIDILQVESVPNAEILHLDFMADGATEELKAHLERAPDFVMSDLAANTTGHKQTDHLKTVALVEAAAEFALDVLAPGGHFITKVFQGGAEEKLLKRLRERFEFVRHAKPKSSRKGSPEIYLVAKGFRPAE
ncbi:MAG: RlmE family RNA methyltransferase [Litorimonas sp.]